MKKPLILILILITLIILILGRYLFVKPAPIDNSQTESIKDIKYNQFDKCIMEIVDDTITPTGLTVRFTSTNENETNYGSYFRVDKYENKEWNEVQKLKFEGKLCWTLTACPIPSNGFRNCKVDWSWLYGELPAGQYRIIKEIDDVRAPGDYESYFLAAEFKIE